MSSWKKASKTNQKTHRERHQPEARAYLGLLEKKKDYQQRSKEYGAKKSMLRALRKKALDKNVDEFYFHMINSKLKKGEHTEKNADGHTPEQLLLMKSQDLNYITHRRNLEKKKIDKLKSELHLLDASCDVKNTHIFYDSDGEPVKVDLAERLGTHPSLVHRKFNRPKLEDLKNFKIQELDPKTSKEAAFYKAKRYKELATRLNREKQLAIIQGKMEMKKHASTSAADNKPIKVKPGTKTSAPVYFWQYCRKK